LQTISVLQHLNNTTHDETFCALKSLSILRGLFHMSTSRSAPTAMRPQGRSGPITVLLVDDDDQLRGWCRSVLKASGFAVLEADNGLEALLTSVQHREAIDLLMTDLEMPGISGMELGRAFNELWPGVNVLYVSGSPSETVVDQLPADCAFLAKPFAPEALVAAVGDALLR
jgi:DNA-binding NtrC family response regulator